MAETVQHEPVPERHAHRARRRRLAHRRFPAREARKGRRVRPHEAEERRLRRRRRQARSGRARSSRGCTPRRRACSTSTTPATRSSSWTRRRYEQSSAASRVLDALRVHAALGCVQVLIVDGAPWGVAASLFRGADGLGDGARRERRHGLERDEAREARDGRVVQVPLFVNKGDRIKVDPRERRYISRVSGVGRFSRPSIAGARSSAPRRPRRRELAGSLRRRIDEHPEARSMSPSGP